MCRQAQLASSSAGQPSGASLGAESSPARPCRYLPASEHRYSILCPPLQHQYPSRRRRKLAGNVRVESSNCQRQSGAALSQAGCARRRVPRTGGRSAEARDVHIREAGVPPSAREFTSLEVQCRSVPVRAGSKVFLTLTVQCAGALS
jgi:hypothetical protein